MDKKDAKYRKVLLVRDFIIIFLIVVIVGVVVLKYFFGYEEKENIMDKSNQQISVVEKDNIDKLLNSFNVANAMNINNNRDKYSNNLYQDKKIILNEDYKDYIVLSYLYYILDNDMSKYYTFNEKNYSISFKTIEGFTKDYFNSKINYNDFNIPLSDCGEYLFSIENNSFNIGITNCITMIKTIGYNYDYEYNDTNKEYYIYRSILFDDYGKYYKDYNLKDKVDATNIDENNYNEFSKYKFTFKTKSKNGIYLYSVEPIQ